jgi:hypothetical protein
MHLRTAAERVRVEWLKERVEQPLPRDGYGDPARAAGDVEHRAAGLLCERRVERDTRVAAVLPVVVDRIGERLQVVVVNQRLPPERCVSPLVFFRRVAPAVLLAPDHRSMARPDPANASPPIGRRYQARCGSDHLKIGRAQGS